MITDLIQFILLIIFFISNMISDLARLDNKYDILEPIDNVLLTNHQDGFK